MCLEDEVNYLYVVVIRLPVHQRKSQPKHHS